MQTVYIIVILLLSTGPSWGQDSSMVSTPEQVATILIGIAENDSYSEFNLICGEKRDASINYICKYADPYMLTNHALIIHEDVLITIEMFKGATLVAASRECWESDIGRFCTLKVKTSDELGEVELVTLYQGGEWTLFAIQ